MDLSKESINFAHSEKRRWKARRTGSWFRMLHLSKTLFTTPQKEPSTQKLLETHVSIADVKSADGADRVDHVVELLARWSLRASVGS